MRIVFFGSGEFGLPTLRALMQHHEVALVVSQPDRPAGRHRRLTPTPIAQFAGQQPLPLLKPEKINDPAVVEQIIAARPQANVVVAFGQKIGQRIIDSPSLGAAATVNLHASLLPKYRGAAPIHWAILGGETLTGNTVFRLVDRMDAGAILGSQPVAIDPLETAGELHDRLSALGPELVLQVLADLEAGRTRPVVQDESQATLAPKLKRGQFPADFSLAAQELCRRIHGLTPWPGLTARYVMPLSPENHDLKLCRAQAVTLPAAREPGLLLEDGVIACGQGGLKLLEVQPPGSKVMAWNDFVHGHPLPPDTRFEPDPSGPGVRGV